MPRPGAGLPPPRLTLRDAAAEAIAGIVQRPGRSGLTMLGTVLGVGAFVAVLGLTATGAGQISRQFSVLEDTTVTVADNGPANNVAPPGTYPAIGFPADAALGAADNDGLAPGDTYDALHTACMNDAGYGQYAADAPYPTRTNRGLGFPQAYGPWGYVGTALAAQEGFLGGSGEAGGGGPAGGGPFGNLPAGAQAAAGKCFNIMENFNNAQFAHSMAIIETLNNYISTDVVEDSEFKKADRNWSACMAKNGFSSPDAETFWAQALNTVLGKGRARGRTPAARLARRPPRRTRRRSRWPWPTRTAR